MAKLIEKEDPQNDDLVILNPHQTVTIDGQEITVREYGFVEGLKLRSLMKPLHDKLYEITQSGQRIELEAILDIVADNPEQITQLMAVSADVEVSWINSLNDADGTLLMMTWWGVCGPFFVRKLSDRIITDQLQRQAEKRALAGVMSTPPLSPTDTTQNG